MRFATSNDIDKVAELLRAMYIEVSPTDTIDNLELFKQLALSYLEKAFIIIDERGFFIVQDETPIVKKTKIWNGVAVYIKPEFRKTTALRDFYNFMFNTFAGTIMGFTEANSEHNKVLLKRHKLLGYVYELYRS